MTRLYAVHKKGLSGRLIPAVRAEQAVNQISSALRARVIVVVGSLLASSPQFRWILRHRRRRAAARLSRDEQPKRIESICLNGRTR